MPAYARHRPETSPLHQLVSAHLDGFLRESREHGGLPRFIEKTFRGYLDGGIPGQGGFSRLHCGACGLDSILAFSCKLRGVCPSCCARFSADRAAHLVDHVLPHVPIRQWVVGLPWYLENYSEHPANLARGPPALAA